MPIYRNKETGHEVTVLEGTHLPKVYEKVEAMPKGSKGADKPKRTSSKPKGSKGADKPEGPDDKSNPETNMEENE